jgi:hypothetical protein
MVHQIRSLRERATAHDLRALFPPANCSEKALFVETEQLAASTLREQITVLETKLAESSAQVSLSL